MLVYGTFTETTTFAAAKTFAPADTDDKTAGVACCYARTANQAGDRTEYSS